MKIGWLKFLDPGAKNGPKLAEISPNCLFSAILVIKTNFFSYTPIFHGADIISAIF